MVPPPPKPKPAPVVVESPKPDIDWLWYEEDDHTVADRDAALAEGWVESDDSPEEIAEPDDLWWTHARASA